MLWETLSLILGILSIYLGKKAITIRRLKVWNIYSSSAKELLIKNVGDIELSFKNRTFSNITSNEFLIFNEGNVAIDGEDIVKNSPITFQCNNDSEIIDYNVESSSHEQILSKVNRVSPREITLGFQWLEKKSGIRIKLLSSGGDPEIKIKGKINKYPPLNKISSFKYRSLYVFVKDTTSDLVNNFELLYGCAILAAFILLCILGYKFFSGPEKSAQIILPNQISLEKEKISLLLKNNGWYVNREGDNNQNQKNIIHSPNHQIIFSYKSNEFAESLQQKYAKDGYTVTFVYADDINEKKYENMEAHTDPNSNFNYKVVTQITPRWRERTNVIIYALKRAGYFFLFCIFIFTAFLCSNIKKIINIRRFFFLLEDIERQEFLNTFNDNFSIDLFFMFMNIRKQIA